MTTILQKASKFMIDSLEEMFYRWGKIVTRFPGLVICACLLVTGLSALGFLKFSQEHRAHKLWIPPTSDFNQHEAWLEKNFKKNRRDELAIYVADNVLTPEALKEMFELQKKVMEIKVMGKTFSDICSKIPISDIYHSRTKRRRRRSAGQSDQGNATFSDEALVEDFFSEINDTDPVNDVTGNEEESKLDPDSEDYDYRLLWGVDYDTDYTKEELEEQYEKSKPRINFFKFARGERRILTDKNDVDLPDDIFCDLYKYMDEVCVQSNLMEIWQYKEDLIETVTQQEILDAVNMLTHSPWTAYKFNYTDLLGQLTHNSTGHIVGAKAARMYWNVKLPDVIDTSLGPLGGIEVDLADSLTMAWEEELIKLMLNAKPKHGTVYLNAGRSFSDVSGEAILFDGIKMAAGYTLMFVYTVFMLGKINFVELRLYLTCVGIGCIGMGLITAMGLTLAMGFPFTSMHTAMPFIALGIGIDDMFVVVQCWSNLEKSDSLRNLPLAEAMGLTLKHAGVAITITSLTDIFAFAVGSITNMPGLQSFCVATSLCLCFIYLFVLTWFIAFLALDQRRIAANRNAIVPCYVHQPSTASGSSEGNCNWSRHLFSVYKQLIASWPFRGLVTAITLALLGIGIWGALNIRQHFDPVLLLPTDTYLRKFVDEHDRLFPSQGWTAEVYLGRLDPSRGDLESLDRLSVGMEQLNLEQNYLRRVDSWWTEMKGYIASEANITDLEVFRSNGSLFSHLLSEFLFAGEGAKYRNNFKLDGELKCRQPAPTVLASKFEFDYVILLGPEEHVPAKQAVESVIQSANVTNVSFSHVKVYAAWETDQIIAYEMWRNIAMSLGCVMIVTLLLLVNIPISFFVFLCVICTLVDIVGYLHFWGLTIDIITCVNIVLSIGLCVDYSVHIGHAYIVAKGTRVDKAVNAVEEIGPAVFNGGFTTFLALVILGFSSSQIFLTFFKVFLLTVIFGLWHGLIMLPVTLSILGPLGSHPQASDETATSSTTPPSIGSRSTASTASLPTSADSEARGQGTASNLHGFDNKGIDGHFNVTFTNSDEDLNSENSRYDRNIFSGRKKGSWSLDHSNTGSL